MHGQVPLGNTVRYPDMEQRSHGQWTPFTALATAHAMIVQKDPVRMAAAAAALLLHPQRQWQQALQTLEAAAADRRTG